MIHRSLRSFRSSNSHYYLLEKSLTFSPFFQWERGLLSQTMRPCLLNLDSISRGSISLSILSNHLSILSDVNGTWARVQETEEAIQLITNNYNKYSLQKLTHHSLRCFRLYATEMKFPLLECMYSNTGIWYLSESWLFKRVEANLSSREQCNWTILCV